jgi:catechol 2,3-dioxygenase-like lactoylglutathione lyase family enzyme
MLDHISLTASNLAASKAFYDAALAPLGIVVLWPQDPEAIAYGYGEAGTQKPYFWLAEGGQVTGRLHVAFTAPSRAAVDAFYKAALAAGGRDNGPPGLRVQYQPDYYGAFVLDPDGWNIEAVCHGAD